MMWKYSLINFYKFIDARKNLGKEKDSRAALINNLIYL